MRALLFFIFSLFLVDACLIIGYSEPPACACQALRMSSKSIFDNVKDTNKFYLNVTTNNIKEPIVDIDDCSGSMYCEGDYSLFVFDTDNEAAFGAYAADGICQPFTQTWLIDNGVGLEKYKELKGVCVLNSVCPCPGTLSLYPDNAYDYLKNNPYYNNVLKNYVFKPAILTFGDDGCQLTRSCEEGWDIRVFLDYEEDPTDFAFQHSECIPTRKPNFWKLEYWRPTVLQTTYIQRVAPVCVDFNQMADS